MSRRTQEQIIVTLVAAAVVLLALNSVRFFFRADITENHIRSISPVSVRMLSSLQDQVSITYYVSDRLKGLTPEVQQIQDLLYEYAAHSSGKVRISVVDPAKKGIEKQVQAEGVVPEQIQVVQQDQQSLATVYSGIVINYLNRSKAIPLVFDTSTLEYDLTSDIMHLSTNTQPVVGILLGDNGETLNQNYRMLGTALSRNYSVRQVQPGETIPPDISVLFVIGNRDLDEFDLFPIDQYIMNGGKALFAVDGVNVDLSRNLASTPAGNSPLLSMLKEYGVQVEQNLVLDKHERRIPIRQPQGNVMVQTLEPYPLWISILKQDVNASNPMTAHFAGLDLYWASPLKLEKRSGVTDTPLLSTSSDSWLMKPPFSMSPTNPAALRKDAASTPGPYIVGATLEGNFESYFAGKQIPTRAGVKRDWKKIIPDIKSSRIVVIGDAQFASDIVQYSNSRYNMTFLANAADWLSNENALLSIRTRATRDLRLNAIQNPALRQFTVFVAEFINIFLIPIGVIVFGIARMYRRRKRAYTHQGEA